ncbi:S1 family peptidase [Streptomyces sp. NPDC020965]|uniref:S1 family peptidase n=1 Tax=Streptomyces sp. NPDC020965 TaxID=3365105 RepID=UPI0037A55D63
MSQQRPYTALTTGVLATLLLAGLATAGPAQAVAGDPATEGSHAFTAKIDIGNGERSCSGALVAPQWIATAAGCFTTDTQSGTVAPGKPAFTSVALVGRTNLSATGGQTAEIVELVPHADRDLVLARLAKPITGVAPVGIGTTAPAPGEVVTAAGYGRTKSAWVPGKLHTSPFTVNSADGGTLTTTAATSASAVCRGDSGGPTLRATGGGFELVAVSSRSSMGGCVNEEDTPNTAVSSRVDDLAEWIGTVTTGAPVTDFNCDGARDIAVGDPEAVVGGDAKAGLVRIVYGAGKGHAELAQDLGTVPGGSEAGDRFGETLATFDHNSDGCTDLVVGIPAEDLVGKTDTGMVQVLYGAPAGLTKGKAALVLEQGAGGGAIGSSAPESGDRMGHSLAAGATATGEPYLLIGAPGEDLDAIVNAGNAFYLRGTTNAAVHEGKDGVTGDVEKDDRFGTAVAASPQHLTIGTPAEAIGTKASAGRFHVFSHKLTGGFPTPLTALDQDSTVINGDAETGDRFGASLAMVPHRPAGAATATESLLAVGSPGEANGDLKESGRVVTLKVSATGKVTQLHDIHQNTADVGGANEAGDRFGERLSAVNTAPDAVSTERTALLAVGVPGEDVGTAADSGSIWVFPLIGAPGAADVPVEPGKVGLPGVSGAGQRLGNSLTATGTHLYVGMPDGPAPTGAAHTVPWANVLSAATEPVTTHQPGKGGLPAAGGAFGTAIG